MTLLSLERGETVKITQSNEDYLEAILLLENNGSTRSIDVANLLKVSKAAVSIAMKDLMDKELVEKAPYGDIYLTAKGKQIATETLTKHNLLRKFLMQIGVDANTAEDECCKIEHILSANTIKCIKSLSEKLSQSEI